MAHITYGEPSWERMIQAVKAVRERLERSVAAFERVGFPYAVIGANAVAAWVAEVDESAVRNTPNVDLLIHRADRERALHVLQSVGFEHVVDRGKDVFYDGPRRRRREALRLVIAGERFKPEELMSTPDVDESVRIKGHNVIALDALVRMKLTAYRIVDRVHLRDLLDVGLIDTAWPARFKSELDARLQDLIDTPDG